MHAARSRQEEIDEVKGAVSRLIDELDLKAGLLDAVEHERMSLTDRVRELGERARREKAEVDAVKAELAHTLAALSGVQAEGAGLKEQIAALIAEHERVVSTYRARVHEAAASLARLKAEHKVEMEEAEELATREEASHRKEVEASRRARDGARAGRAATRSRAARSRACDGSSTARRPPSAATPSWVA